MGAIFHYFKNPLTSCLLARGDTREDIVGGYELMTGVACPGKGESEYDSVA